MTTKSPTPKPKEPMVKVWYGEKGSAVKPKCQLCKSVSNCVGDHFKKMTADKANAEIQAVVFKSLSPMSVGGKRASVVTPDGTNYWR